MKNGRMQCKDIPDYIVHRAVESVRRWNWPGAEKPFERPITWSRAFYSRKQRGAVPVAKWPEVLAELQARLPHVPEKLLYTKLHKTPGVHSCGGHRWPKWCSDSVHLESQCQAWMRAARGVDGPCPL